MRRFEVLTYETALNSARSGPNGYKLLWKSTELIELIDDVEIFKVQFLKKGGAVEQKMMEKYPIHIMQVEKFLNFKRK